jgi:predicted lysophospholipase L1 biosynthesis ABC-type transport system permease subunit
MVRSATLRELRLAVAAVLAAASVSPAIAQGMRQELKQACINDVRVVCAGVFPGGGRIKKCMAEKFDQLSDGCKSALKQAQAAGK